MGPRCSQKHRRLVSPGRFSGVVFARLHGENCMTSKGHRDNTTLSLQFGSVKVALPLMFFASFVQRFLPSGCMEWVGDVNHMSTASTLNVGLIWECFGLVADRTIVWQCERCYEKSELNISLNLEILYVLEGSMQGSTHSECSDLGASGGRGVDRLQTHHSPSC